MTFSLSQRDHMLLDLGVSEPFALRADILKFVIFKCVLSKYALKSEHASGMSRADPGRADAKQYCECERPYRYR